MKKNPPPPDAAAPSSLIADRYEIRRRLGSGGSGDVFQAWDKQLQRFVAAKRWHPLEPVLDDPAGTERLWHEAMTLAAIQHPNILTIHDFGVDEEGPYVITEFIDGETIDEVVRRAPGAAQSAIRLGAQAASCAAAAASASARAMAQVNVSVQVSVEVSASASASASGG